GWSAAAQRAVYNRDFSWYFLHMIYDQPDLRPWIALENGQQTVVSIPGAVTDYWWQTIDCPRTDAEYIRGVADKVLTEDGSGGRGSRGVDAGRGAAVVAHLPSL